MDENQGLWQRLTDWNRSPIYRFFRYFRVNNLIQLLKDEDVRVRRNAVWVLPLLGHASAAPASIEALKDEDREVRRDVAYALGQIGDASAVPVLIEALKDENEDVRRNAAQALGWIVGECETTEELEKVEEGIEEGLAALRKKHVDKRELIGAQIKIARVTSKIAQKKDKLAPKKDLLLEERPKPPNRGKGERYQAVTRVRNG